MRRRSSRWIDEKPRPSVARATLADGLGGDVDWSSLGHGEIGDRHVALHLGLEHEAQPATPESRQRNQQDRYTRGDGEVAPLEQNLERGPVDLADHPLQAGCDGVVHHDSQHHDEGHQRDQVDGQIQARHQEEGAEKRERYTEAHPEGEAQPQEERQHQQHQREAIPTIAKQGIQARAKEARVLLPDGQRHSGGEILVGPLEVVAHGGRDLERALVAHPVDLHQRRRPPVEARHLVRFLEAVYHAGHVTEPEPRSVGTREQDQLLELASPVGLTLGADQDLAAGGLHGAAGQIQRGSPHRANHVVEGEAVSQQRILRDLDGDLVGTRGDQLDVGDSRERRDLVAHLLAEKLESRLVHITRDRDVQHLEADLGLEDDGLLRLLGEAVDPVDAALDLAEAAADVLAGQQLDGHLADALGSGGADVLDTLEPLELLLDADADTLLDLHRRGTRIDHAHRDDVEADLGHELLLDGEERENSPHHQEHHQQIGGDVIRREPGNRAIHDSAASTPALAFSTSLGFASLRAPTSPISARLAALAF